MSVTLTARGRRARTTTWLLLLATWAVLALFVGLVAGAAITRSSYDCGTSTDNGGMTYVETCTREVTP